MRYLDRYLKYEVLTRLLVYLVAGGWQGAFYYEAAARVEGSRYLGTCMGTWVLNVVS